MHDVIYGSHSVVLGRNIQIRNSVVAPRANFALPRPSRVQSRELPLTFSPIAQLLVVGCLDPSPCCIRQLTMTLDKRALSRPTCWDAKYAHGEGHEWYRTYEDLEAFFQTHFYDNHRVSPKADPLVLHLGSGDSVSAPPPAAPRRTLSY